MIYYIVPPIIFILGLSALIYFIYKKTDLVNQRAESLKESEIHENRSSTKLKNIFLNLSEKITRRVKLVFLKFYNISDRMSHTIREKKIKAKDRFVSEAEFNREPERVISEEIKPRKEIESVKSYPMVSKRIVKPESKKGSKSQLEQILIGRIAANPRDIEAYERLGDYYIERESWEDARECFKQVLKLSPVNRKAKIRMKSLEKRILGW